MKTQEFVKKYYIDRKKGNSVKWSMYKKDHLLPMWIADMDFKCDERIIKSLSNFINEADYGYNNLPNDYYDVFINWHLKRNNIKYNRDSILFSRGAVNAMYQVIYSLTKKNDYIMINTPLYPPFKATILQTKRKVIESPLINNNGYFTYDYENIEKKFKTKKVKMLMLCSPHNPIGRVWKKSELDKLFALCKKYHVLICSDEVHSDIIMPGFKFIPSLSFKKYKDIIVSITAASKSFSLAVFSHCHIITNNKNIKDKIMNYQKDNGLHHVNIMNALPTYYSYMYGESWLNDLNNVVYENYEYVKKTLNNFEISTLQGSYLIFLNLGKYNDHYSASDTLKEKCLLRVNPGESFDKKYHNWVRINLATKPDNVKKACKEILKLTK